MSKDVYESAKNENYLLEIYRDEDAESPRQWDNLGTMICWHRRYNLGDKHNYENPIAFIEELAIELGIRIEEDMDEHQIFDEIIRQHKAVILPLYLYDHSGITMNTTGFACPWDSGQVGYIYMTLEHFDNETAYKNLSFAEKMKKIEEYLIGEVETYDQYLTGEVFGYKLYKINQEMLREYAQENGYDEFDDIDNDELIDEGIAEEIDASWGYYGDNFLTNGVLDNIGNEPRELVDEVTPSWAKKKS